MSNVGVSDSIALTENAAGIEDYLSPMATAANCYYF